MPEMRRATVRFGESLWSLIEDEANRDGVSAAQWIRDAALARAMWERNRRGEANGRDVLEVVREEHRSDQEHLMLAVRDVLAHARPELDRTIEKLPPESAQYVRELYGL